MQLYTRRSARCKKWYGYIALSSPARRRSSMILSPTPSQKRHCLLPFPMVDQLTENYCFNWRHDCDSDFLWLTLRPIRLRFDVCTAALRLYLHHHGGLSNSLPL